MEKYSDLKRKITQIDQAIKDFAALDSNKFSLRLEFPAVRQQQKEGTQAVGYEKEAFSLTALAITCLDKLEGSEKVNYLQLLSDITPKLEKNIKDFLIVLQQTNAKQLYNEVKEPCEDIIHQLSYLTRKNQKEKKPKPSPTL